ncbi:DUF4192 domain-containing protein [Nocardia iowensis]|uniref:DUF4192 domain-containing protein n=1 Tax=Nocardia iowensis TaxID=204891 RepID=A0ABX8RYY1_NOCIO|nr:DUF4192 domain-containing protein [Nocardia iowensis]QXN94753.1 DUF4192 domain-containing protein [Nocardia iowensis]
MAAVGFDDPGEVIAALPAIYRRPIPSRALVLIALRSIAPGIGRVDDLFVLDPYRPGGVGFALEAVQTRLARILTDHRPGSIGAVVIDDRQLGDDGTARAYRPLTSLLTELLTASSSELTNAWHIAALDPGQLWSSLIGQNSCGVLSDFALDTITRDLLARQQAEALVIVDPDPVFAILVSRALAAITESPDAPSTATSRHRLLVVLACIDALSAGHEPTPPELAEVAVALRDPLVRDCMYGVAISAKAATAQTLWARLTRVLPEPDRSQVAGMLSATAFLAGNGTLAALAIRTAFSGGTDQHTAKAIGVALDSGIRPHMLRRLAQLGQRTAAELGVKL